MLSTMSRAPRRTVVGVLVAGLAVGATLVATPAPAQADDVTVSYDRLRTGWDPNEPTLSPSDVSAADFGQLFATQLDGQIYAKPVVARSTVMAVTENNNAYGLDPVSGAIRWTRNVGRPWPASAIGCGDLVPNIGITGTPVVDPATGTAYFTSKVNDGPDLDHPHWYLHALDITTGAERSGFPTTIQGNPSNDPTNTFIPKTAMQRPGLLLLDGVVYAAFASHCDVGPYVGYVVGVDAATGRQTTLWASEVGSSKAGAGIWQSGGGLVSDGPRRIFLTTGNGVSPPPGPGTSPPGTLAEAVVRLQVNSDGSLVSKDFFSPVNNTNLDTDDTDLGSGNPLAIPDGFGTPSHPHLIVQVGKEGKVYLLDRDNLGGMAQGPGGTDATLQTLGPYNGVWGYPAFWGGRRWVRLPRPQPGTVGRVQDRCLGERGADPDPRRQECGHVRLHVGLAGGHVQRHDVRFGVGVGGLQQRRERCRRSAPRVLRAALERLDDAAVCGSDRHRDQVLGAGHRQGPGLRGEPDRSGLRLRPTHHGGSARVADRLRLRGRRFHGDGVGHRDGAADRHRHERLGECPVHGERQRAAEVAGRRRDADRAGHLHSDDSRRRSPAR